MGRKESAHERLRRRFAQSDGKAWALLRRRHVVPCVMDALAHGDDLRALLVERRVPDAVAARVRALVAHLALRCANGNPRSTAYVKEHAETFLADLARAPHRLFRRYARLALATDNAELHRRLEGLAPRVVKAIAPAARAAAADERLTASVIDEAVRALDAVERFASRVARSPQLPNRSAAAALLHNWEGAPTLVQAVCSDSVAGACNGDLRVRPAPVWVRRCTDRRP